MINVNTRPTTLAILSATKEFCLIVLIVKNNWTLRDICSNMPKHIAKIIQPEMKTFSNVTNVIRHLQLNKHMKSQHTHKKMETELGFGQPEKILKFDCYKC